MGGQGLIAALALAGSGCLFAPPPGGLRDDAGGDPDDAGVRSDGGEPDDDAAGPPALLTCPSAASPPVLDGVDDALWSGAPALLFEVSQAEHKVDLNPSYTQDARATVRCLDDAVNLYFFVEVVDGLTVSTRPIQVDGPDSREDDGVVLFLHAAAGDAGVYDAGAHAILLPAREGDAAAFASDFGPAPLTPTGAILTDEGGYRIEIAIDRDSIAVPLPSRLRFNLGLIDDDGWSDECRDIFALMRQPGIPCIECCPGEDWTSECVNYSVGEALAWCDTRVSDELALE